MLSGSGFMPFVEKRNLRSLRMVQVMRSLVVLSVPLTILCNGWLHHQILEGTDIHLKDIIALVAALSEDGRERQKLCLPLVFHRML
jgi:hypothetical protein